MISTVTVVLSVRQNASNSYGEDGTAQQEGGEHQDVRRFIWFHRGGISVSRLSLLYLCHDSRGLLLLQRVASEVGGIDGIGEDLR